VWLQSANPRLILHVLERYCAGSIRLTLAIHPLVTDKHTHRPHTTIILRIIHVNAHATVPLG
jgi:hypothetical protein